MKHMAHNMARLTAPHSGAELYHWKISTEIAM